MPPKYPPVSLEKAAKKGKRTYTHLGSAIVAIQYGSQNMGIIADENTAKERR